MEIYQSWQGFKGKQASIAVGLGNFDGVHLGHQKLLGALVNTALRLEEKSAVFTFHPHPEMVLNSKNAPPLLLTQEVKEKLISKMGVDLLFRIPFTLEFSRMEPEVFIEKVLYEGLNVRDVFIGYNYTFGYKGRGTAALLEEYSGRCDYRLHVLPPVIVDNQAVSSTLIRNLLKEGEVAEAARFLGYPPFFEGVVVVGDRRGAALGISTINLEYSMDFLLPANGVYVVKVDVEQDTYLGVANIGNRPTFYDYSSRPGVEVHLLDFTGDLYGKIVSVHFTRRLRDEKKFSSSDELIVQIRQDIQRARENS
ncbi:MAG TPA: riboflavin biosynthesis protein RibF [Desulfotomaculum sp.]|nr:MAG: Riboflavin biosynthesis protein RibF [Desulfotomaculum sp. 46_80]HAG11699.1 riboflavin biosynthesis protein RibF [Desulfotomaculum sp.]HBY05028.1 riboflavin biosynthesis protein RibF [Desulfotomaculum sp.]